MCRYVIKRLLMMVLVVIGVSFLLFFIMDMAPGDLAMSALGSEATDEELEAFRTEHELDKPLLYRYTKYMGRLMKGDLGYSYVLNLEVITLYGQRLPATLLLALSATLVATLLSIPLGIFAALRQGKLADNVVSAIATLGMATPNFWVGLMLIILFALKLGWFKSSGFQDFSDVILPAITIGTGFMALMTRTTRSSMIDVLRADYLMLARAKGVSEKKVVRKHALKNALIPIITVVGMQFSAALGGAVITESVFAWPGVGRLIIDAIKAQDVELVTGSIILTSILTSFVLLVVDVLYAYVDPRIKAQYSK